MIKRIGLTHRWSDSVVANGFAFVAGHTAEKTRGQPIEAQTREVLELLDETLAASGTSKEFLMSVQIFLTDIRDIAAMNVVWDEWVAAGAAPSRATVEGRLGAPDLAIEITAVALVGGSKG